MRGRKRKDKSRTLCDQEALCPMFQFHTRRYIVCEGVIPDTKCESVFGTEEQKDVQYKAFCCGKWQNCEIYRAIYANQYAEED